MVESGITAYTWLIKFTVPEMSFLFNSGLSPTKVTSTLQDNKNSFFVSTNTGDTEEEELDSRIWDTCCSGKWGGKELESNYCACLLTSAFPVE